MLSRAHALIGLILVASHALFFCRAMSMRRRNGRPGRLDRIARFLSHAGLPAAIITGLIVLTTANSQSPETALRSTAPKSILIIHIILGLTPVILIFAFTPLLPLKRRIPWLLPALNLALFLAAVVAGLFLSCPSGS